ncbi:DUF1758 domain-containing protein [Nephila pilipes]|uniref:DUF1758 domain-containing protein n=1 Tax=Nephila pilipes TaxID=299642 RepID=A0A8X6PD21_NEPPI|nr:DUF1758 domain-containing protein [Nephila pilipes]
MEILNRSRSTLKGKISRIETFIKSANEETDSVETKVKLKNVTALQRNIAELRINYYSIPNVKDAELASIDQELNLLEERLEKLETPVSGLNGLKQNLKWKLNTIISNEDSSFAEPIDVLIVDKITEFTPSSCFDISNVEIPQFLTLADKSFYEAKEVHALISADIFFKVLKQNTYKLNEELFFKESEFGWIACGKLRERQIDKQGQCFLLNNDSIRDILKLFFDLEGLGIRDDPVLQRDQAMEIFKETVEFENGRYIVQLPFRKSYNELSDNYSLAKQRFQNLWRRLGHDSELYQQYRVIILDYAEQGIIEEVKTETTDNELKRPVYYLPHQAIRKEGRLTSKTRILSFNESKSSIRRPSRESDNGYNIACSIDAEKILVDTSCLSRTSTILYVCQAAQDNKASFTCSFFLTARKFYRKLEYVYSLYRINVEGLYAARHLASERNMVSEQLPEYFEGFLRDPLGTIALRCLWVTQFMITIYLRHCS